MNDTRTEWRPRNPPAHLAMLELLIEMGEITVVGGDA